MSDVQEQPFGERGAALDLSILIVSYHSAETIEQCLKSILSDLKQLEAEILVVDNNSTDGTPALLTALAKVSPCIKPILNQHNMGFAVGNNQALELARGKHILILNPDTVIHPGSLLGLWRTLEEHPQIALVAPRMQYPDGRLQKTCRRFPTHLDVIYNSFGLARLFPRSRRFNGWKMGDFDHLSARQVEQPAGAALMIRGGLLRELGGFDLNFPMFFNDVDLCKRIEATGAEIWFRPEFIVDHVGGASVRQARVKMTLSSHVSFFRYFEKHFTRLHQQPLNFLVGVLLYLSLVPRLLLLVFKGSEPERKRDTL